MNSEIIQLDEYRNRLVKMSEDEVLTLTGGIKMSEFKRRITIDDKNHYNNIFSGAFDTSVFNFDNKNASTLSWDNLNNAYEAMRKIKDSDGIYIKQSSPTFIVPPEITVNEQKYWVPYGNVAVVVNEEVNYKFVYRLQGYLRNKWQNVSLPRFRSAL